MTRFVLPAAVLLHVACVQAAQPEVVSPEVQTDRRITFRLRAPKAVEVKLWGDWIRKFNTLETLAKDEQGVWSVTVGPLAPNLYSYLWLVDEVPLEQKLVEVTGDAPALYSRRDVPHGTLHQHTYGPGGRPVVVYTPPGYDGSSKRRYPVLYLIHGASENERTWTEKGRAHWILDNLVAEGRMAPRIVVMPNGDEDDLVTAAIPFVEANYRTGERMIAGSSKGGFQALSYAFENPRLFAGIGTFSAGIWDQHGIDQAERFAPVGKLKLFWSGCGDNDRNLTLARRLDATLTRLGVAHQFVVAPGQGHTWLYWREALVQFLTALPG